MLTPVFDVDYKNCKGDLYVQEFGEDPPYPDYDYEAGVSISMSFGELYELIDFWDYFCSLINPSTSPEVKNDIGPHVVMYRYRISLGFTRKDHPLEDSEGCADYFSSDSKVVDIKAIYCDWAKKTVPN